MQGSGFRVKDLGWLTPKPLKPESWKTTVSPCAKYWDNFWTSAELMVLKQTSKFWLRMPKPRP